MKLFLAATLKTVNGSATLFTLQSTSGNILIIMVANPVYVPVLQNRGVEAIEAKC